MTLSVHLDTNVLLWISQGRIRTLGDRAFRLATRLPWVISPIVSLELEILHEIGRIKATPKGVLNAVREQGSLRFSGTAFADIMEGAAGLSWTRDPIDRLVTAHAMADGAKLLTADANIRANFKDAVWD